MAHTGPVTGSLYLYICIYGPHRACNWITLPSYIYIYMAHAGPVTGSLYLYMYIYIYGPHRACNGISLPSIYTHIYTYINRMIIPQFGRRLVPQTTQLAPNRVP